MQRQKILLLENRKLVSQMEKCLVSHDFIIAVFRCIDDLWHQMTEG